MGNIVVATTGSVRSQKPPLAFVVRGEVYNGARLSKHVKTQSRPRNPQKPGPGGSRPAMHPRPPGARLALPLSLSLSHRSPQVYIRRTEESASPRVDSLAPPGALARRLCCRSPSHPGNIILVRIRKIKIPSRSVADDDSAGSARRCWGLRSTKLARSLDRRCPPTMISVRDDSARGRVVNTSARDR